jgi:hypothetical protein
VQFFKVLSVKNGAGVSILITGLCFRPTGPFPRSVYCGCKGAEAPAEPCLIRASLLGEISTNHERGTAEAQLHRVRMNDCIEFKGRVQDTLPPMINDWDRG